MFANADGTYIYCQIVKMRSVNNSNKTNKNANDDDGDDDECSNINNNSHTNIEYEFTVQIDDNGAQLVKIAQKDLHVLENWHRIYDAIIAKPPDERESFKYQDNANSKNTSGGGDSNSNGNSHNGYNSHHIRQAIMVVTMVMRILVATLVTATNRTHQATMVAMRICRQASRLNKPSRR